MRDDLALLDQDARGVDIVEHGMLVETGRPAVEPHAVAPGAASVAGDRLGVIAPVGGIAIFGRAIGAERKGAMVVLARS